MENNESGDYELIDKAFIKFYGDCIFIERKGMTDPSFFYLLTKKISKICKLYLGTP